MGVLTMLTPPERVDEHMEAWTDIPTATSSKLEPLGREQEPQQG